MPEGLFDHCPVVVRFLTHNTTSFKPFKYFNMWSSLPSFLERVGNYWSMPVKGTPMFCLVSKLKRLKPVLREVNREF